MRELDDKLFILTGAAGGIGRAAAQRLREAGARLALVDRDAAGLEALRARLPATRPTTTHVFDLRARAGLPDLIAAIARAHGPIHGLIHNAGLTVHRSFASMSLDELDLVLDVDLRAVTHLTHAALPRLRAAPGGAHVVLIASIAGVVAYPYQSAYSAAKFALRGFGQALRVELAPLGIGVSTILPGAIATGFLEDVPSDDPEGARRLAALMRRYGTAPDRVARAIIRAIRRDQAERYVGWDSHLSALLARALPGLLPALLRLAYLREQLGRRARGGD